MLGSGRVPDLAGFYVTEEVKMWKRIMGFVMMVALVLNFAGAAHAGVWPRVGDMVNRNGTVLKVAKMKMRGDTAATMVCLNKTGNRNA